MSNGFAQKKKMQSNRTVGQNKVWLSNVLVICSVARC